MRSFCFEDVEIGQSAQMERTVRDQDLVSFAEVTGDHNPVHLDEAFAAKTSFGGRIAHGMLSAGYVSAVLGTKLPGPGAIYLSQSLNFKRPVRIGDVVVTRVQVLSKDEAKARITLATTCSVNDKLVLQGEAVVMAPRKQPPA